MPLKTLIKPNHSLDEIWKVLTIEFQKACCAKRHPFRYVVLSTANEGHANSRWVVLRKYTETASFLIYTDARSGKSYNRVILPTYCFTTIERNYKST